MNTHQGNNHMDTQTQTPAAPVTEATTTTTKALALVTPTTSVAEFVAPVWDDARIALAKKTICPPGTSDQEFEYFIAWSKRTGLDPFIQQSYLVPRREKNASGQWVEKKVPMAAVAGMAARADSMPDYRGMRSGIVYVGDHFFVDEDQGIVEHKWTLEARLKAGNKMIGAWAHAKRDGRHIPVTYLTQPERDPGNGSPFWSPAKAPAQLRKCCEAEQYRKAYPNIFSGVYIEGEYERVERDVTPALTTSSGMPDAKTDALKAKLGVKTVSPASATVPDPTPTPTSKKSEELPPVTHVRHGKHKGKALVDLSTPELEEALAVTKRSLADSKPGGWWIEPFKESVEAMINELERRITGGAPPSEATEPEPGSEG